MRISTLLKKIIIATKKNQSIIPSHDECIIFGSGPSLDKLDGNSTFLEGKDLIGCNFIHQHQSLAEKSFKFFSMVDRDYTRQVNRAYFQSIDSEHFLVSTKNAFLLDCWCLKQKNIHMIPTKTFGSAIENDLVVSGKELVTGNSLPFLIQCAAFLAGYKTIYLYGVDHFSMDSFDNSKDHNFNKYHGRKVKNLAMTRDKLLYINRLYDFVAGLCEQESVKVLNLTPDSKLEAFKKINIDGLVTLPSD